MRSGILSLGRNLGGRKKTISDHLYDYDMYPCCCLKKSSPSSLKNLGADLMLATGLLCVIQGNRTEVDSKMFL